MQISVNIIVFMAVVGAYFLSDSAIALRDGANVVLFDRYVLHSVIYEKVVCVLVGKA